MIRTDVWTGNRRGSMARQGETLRADGCHESLTYGSPQQASLRPEQKPLVQADSLPPARENRGEKILLNAYERLLTIYGTEMKHMSTNAPASSIAELPEPFRGAVQSSRLFKWERRQGLETTGCLASLFPKDNAQDASFTIWCGNADGYHLNNFFGLQHVVSS